MSLYQEAKLLKDLKITQKKPTPIKSQKVKFKHFNLAYFGCESFSSIEECIQRYIKTTPFIRNCQYSPIAAGSKKLYFMPSVVKTPILNFEINFMSFEYGDFYESYDRDSVGAFEIFLDAAFELGEEVEYERRKHFYDQELERVDSFKNKVEEDQKKLYLRLREKYKDEL